MYVIAVTGRLASGKSTVSRLVAARGGCLIDADEISKQLLEKGTPEYYAVLNSFGEEIHSITGKINRKVLAQKAFSDPENLKKLEDIIHPAVRRTIIERLNDARKTGWKFVVLDIPLLEKSGLKTEIDFIILVTAEKGNIIERAISGGMDEQSVLIRLSAQPTVKELEQVADYVIDNNGNLDDLRSKVDDLFNARLQHLI